MRAVVHMVAERDTVPSNVNATLPHGLGVTLELLALPRPRAEIPTVSAIFRANRSIRIGQSGLNCDAGDLGEAVLE